MNRLNYTKKMYDQMMKYAVSMRPNTSTNVYHNGHRLKEIGRKGPKTYEGYMACGQMTYCLAPILYEEGHRDIKLLFSKVGYGNHSEDHVHLLVNKYYVVDPTWRQFFGEYLHGNAKLSKFLYEDNPPIFVGTYLDLYITISHAIELSELKYNADKNWIHGMWKRSRDVSDRLSMREC